MDGVGAVKTTYRTKRSGAAGRKMSNRKYQYQSLSGRFEEKRKEESTICV
jgi:hypothetical protein